MKIQFSNVSVSLDAMLPQNGEALKREIFKACGLDKASLRKASQNKVNVGEVRILRRSVDARRKSDVHFVLSILADVSGLDASEISGLKLGKGVSVKPYEAPASLEVVNLGSVANEAGYLRPIVIGAGPAGLFCALYLARAGLRPLVIERGKPAIERMRDIEKFAEGGRLNVNSNVQFGEGGAGTFSDGKLNSGIKSPHIRHVLQEFVNAGAPEDILVDAKPHIGTDKLLVVVQNLTHAIKEAGGDFLFNTKLEDIELDKSDTNVNKAGLGYSRVSSICVCHINDDGSKGASEAFPTNICVLAIGHSARDTFAMLDSLGIQMQRKPFAAGVRIEHLQKDLDRSQYGKFANHPALGAADYKLALRNADGRGVYIFCMCPGGKVVAAASEEGGVCVNGMSEHARDGENGNSAILVEIRPDDLPGDDVLEGMRFQQEMERAAYNLGLSKTNVPYTAPVQTVEGFLEGSAGLPSRKVIPTYPRELAWVDLHDCLPDFMGSAIAEALPAFGSKLRAFEDGQAVLTALEARSSSPVRILRNEDDMCSVCTEGVYPCGEGAGYAGGIMSAAVDGIRVAEAICASL